MFRFFVICFVFSIIEASSDIVNIKVDRTIDISSQIVKVTSKITLQNTGKSPVSTFLFALEPNTKHHLAFVGASQTQDEVKQSLKTEETIVTNHREKALYKIHLPTPLAAGKITNVDVETVFSHFLIPHPSHISQSEKQMVLYHGNHYFFSPYSTRSQTTVITLPSNSVESYSKNVKPASHSENTINYGPYDNVGAFTLSKLTVHCENNNPFLTVTKLDRAIEVSHWGVISVEEVLDVVHTGAVLKGPFSRYEFQRDQSGIASVKSFKTVLPASANDVYYRDEIGNISTSHLRELDDSVEVELRPRFPLFGGWKTHYVLGYYVPTYEYLFNSGDQYILKVRFVDHIFDDSVTDDATVKVILPEGSRNIQTKFPFATTRMPDELHHTYLDTIGRPVVILHKSNLVEQHIQDFEVHYEYQKLLMLQEPLLVVFSLYLLFILVIVYVRLDFSLTKDSASEGKLRVSGYLELIRNHHDKRIDLYGSYEEAVKKFKHNKDVSTYQLLIKKLNGEYKTETQAITELLSKLKQEGAEIADKIVLCTAGGRVVPGNKDYRIDAEGRRGEISEVADLQRHDKTLKEYLHQQLVLLEKLIGSKISKQQYVDAETAITKKKEEVVEKMQATLALL